MSRTAKTWLGAALVVTILVQVGWSVPAAATSQVEALSGCVRHCKQARSLAAASRCCGVDTSANDPARAADASKLDRPAPAVLAVLPAAPVVALPVLPVRVVTAAREAGTGPPRFLRLLTLLI